jgi:2-polyprenyl-3-methyl-5-hydroxy-6-metoxy-1,4-benzoquinol methylase
MKQHTMLSPLDSNTDAHLVKTVPVSLLVNLYKEFGIDVSRYFHHLKEISVYECQKTGYRFYYPFNIDGDSAFYEHFQQFDWYYMPWKWEHEISTRYIKNGNKILEVGCAHGAFLKRVNELFTLAPCIGLELNESTPQADQNWSIVNETVQHFQKTHANTFDIVCSYQVLEHISEVRSFLEASITCLKPGGTLIISVPNNESFIKDSEMCLNYPPHHMGLWDTRSLKALTDIFHLELINVHYEPLQEYHIGSYLYSKHYIQYPRLMGKIVQKAHKITGLYSRRRNKVIEKRSELIGHTIMATFKKIEA